VITAPAALTVAGLDPSGGAGIAADLRAFEAAGAWGCAACAVLTVQSTRGLREAVAIDPRLLAAQIEEVLLDVRVRAIKTGALGSAANSRALVKILGRHRGVPVVVDPVMLPSRSRGGARLDGRGAITATRELTALATLVTPNRAEAATLLGETSPIDDVHARDAAVALLELGARAVLVKGGHGGGATSIDWLALASGRVERIARARLAIPGVHGTGCTLASLIAGRLATTRPNTRLVDDTMLIAAVRWARGRLARALARPLSVGGGLAVLAVGRTPTAKPR
jgi:hydroxymethylpyrimidine/phosphomethylpyrimidine kinase